MQPDQKRHGPGTLERTEAANHKHRASNSTLKRSDVQRSEFGLSRSRIRLLLLHHAGFVEAVLIAICSGESISMAGRRALAFTIERMRDCAEGLR